MYALPLVYECGTMWLSREARVDENKAAVLEVLLENQVPPVGVRRPVMEDEEMVMVWC
jgi:hypothetical protein